MEDDLLQEPEEDQPGREVIIIFAVFFEAGLALVSVLGWLFGHPPLEHFVWSMRDATWGVVAAIPLYLDVPGDAALADRPAARVKKFCDNEVVPLLAKSSWSEIALGLAVGGRRRGDAVPRRGASLVERLARECRGAGLASLLFGLFHPISVTYMVIAALLGLYLGAMFWVADGNLLTVMVTHALYDFAALAYLIRIRPSYTPAPTRSS